MPTGWLIYTQRDALENESFIAWFVDEAKRQHLTLQLVYRETIQFGVWDGLPTVSWLSHASSKPDFSIVRTIDPLLSEHLEACGVQVFNTSVISHIANHKGRTHLYMSRLGVPMQDTLFFDSETIPQSPPMAYPFVVKQATSRGGRDVHLIRNATGWDKLKSECPKKDFLMQTCNVKLGRDLRVFVVGRHIVGSVLRENDADFRANFKLGGTATFYTLNSSEKKLVTSIINAFDFDMVGLDFLIGNDGQLIFNEMEDVVGSRILSATSDVNILRQYIAHIKSKLT